MDRYSRERRLATGQGDLYFSSAGQVREIVFPAGTIKTIAGTGNFNYASDGIPATQANISSTTALTFDSVGNLWIADAGNARLFEVSATSGLIHSVAGVYPNGDGGPAQGAPLSYPGGLVLDGQGDIYFSSGTAVRRVDHGTGIISSYVSNLLNPTRLAFDHQGNLYVSTQNGIIRVDASSHATSTIPVGGAGIAFDQDDNLIVADTNQFKVLRVDRATGAATTIASNGQPNAVFSQGGVATQVPIGPVYDVAFSPDNLLYMTVPGAVLKIDANGVISRVAGVGLAGACLHGAAAYSGDGGPASLASICVLSGLTFDSAGNFFVSDVWMQLHSPSSCRY